jgi:hypothetical protein
MAVETKDGSDEAGGSSSAAPCSVERTHRSVIEHKLLTALEGDQVAILATKQDLEDMISALMDYELTKCLPRWKAHRERCKNLCDGMRQLLREAFPPNSD